MRNFKTTIIALVCLAVAVAAFFTVKAYLKKNADDSGSSGSENVSTTSEPTEETRVDIFDFDTSKVVKIESQSEEYFSLYYADEKWNCSSHTELDVFDNSVESFIKTFESLSGNVIKDYDSLSDFEIADDSMYTTLVLDDGTTFSVRFGITDNTETYRYITVDGVEDTVYSIYNFTASDILLTRNLLVKLEALSFSDGYNPSYFVVKKNGELMMSAYGTFKAAASESEKDSITWAVKEPIEIAGESDDINNLVNSLKDVALSELYDGECSDLSQYGLDMPTIEYSIVYSDSSGNKESRSIALGHKTPDASKYYCIIDGVESSVYTIDASYIMIDITLEDYIDGKLFYDMYTDLKTVDIHFEGSDHTMKFVFGDNNLEERYFDDVFVHDEDSYQDENLDTPEDKFNHLLASLYLISITTVDTDAPAEKGELLIKVVYTRIDGTSVVVECYKRDDTTAYLYKDGEYFGGYMETAVILYGDFEDYGIKGSLDVLVDVMK
ncbi:MAG: DUF4340 domain-containing protein [Clostridia bacterium]|nr:DUF4340 domain-containing protein [Clostridia bacterium]